MKKIIVLIILIGFIATSCSTQRACHTKGAYVSKSVKKAQNKPRN